MMRCAPWFLVCLLIVACSRSNDGKNNPASEPLPSRAEIWAAIQPLAQRYQLSPEFVYAVVAAESNFDPRAQNGDACGLMQLKPAAWQSVSTLPYEPTVWRWRKNLEAGIDYLAYVRSAIHRKTTFSYPLLLGSFHYGLQYVEERSFDVHRIPVPDNAIYRELWSGNLAPVPPP